MALNARQREIIAARGLDAELLETLGVDRSDKLSSGEAIVIPFTVGGQVVNRKHRTLEGEKRFVQEANARKVFWNQDCIADPTLKNEPLIITEGEFDAMAAIQAGFARVVSVPDGAPAQAIGENADSRKYSYLDEAPQALREVREIILCADSDAPGINLMNDLALRLGKARCKWVKYPKQCKDLNDALRLYGVKGVTETIARAQWIKVDGVYRMSELPPLHIEKPHSTGIVGMDYLFKMRLGDLTVITGIPGHGKTTVINEICARMAMTHGWGAAFASFEQQPQTDHRRALRTLRTGKMVVHMSEDELAYADTWIDRNFSFIVPNEDDEVTLSWLLERAAVSVIQHGVKILVVDPWNEMDHTRPPDMSLTEYTGFAIKQFRKFARKYHVHVIVAAHPTKQKKNDDGQFNVPSLYDISDSQHWYNKPDVGMIVHRLDALRTLIRVAKVRYHNEIGKPGDLIGSFNPETGKYLIYEDEGVFKAAA